MPKSPKKPSQMVKFTCDADNLSMATFDNILATRVGAPKQKSSMKMRKVDMSGIQVADVADKATILEHLSARSIPCGMQDAAIE